MAGRGTKFYRKNEAILMKQLGLKPTSNSGAGWIEKADGQNEHIICELKSTDAMSASVKLKDIVKLEDQAIVCGKVPAFVIQFLQSDDVFLIVRPSAIKDVANYLETGEYKPPERLVEINESKTSDKVKVVSSSKARQKFWDERSERYKK